MAFLVKGLMAEQALCGPRSGLTPGWGARREVLGGCLARAPR